MLTNNASKINYITYLNVASTVAVVVLHTNGCFWEFSKARWWITANVIESIFYFAVPVFFMISGAMLIDYKTKYSTKIFFAKRVRKTVIPFVAWSLFGFAVCYAGWIMGGYRYSICRKTNSLCDRRNIAYKVCRYLLLFH